MNALRTSVALACIVLGWTQRATAGERETAVELAHQAAQAYKAGNYTAALQKFEAAYRAFPAPAVVVNLSRTELKLQHCQKALDYAHPGGSGECICSTDSDCTSNPAGYGPVCVMGAGGLSSCGCTETSQCTTSTTGSTCYMNQFCGCATNANCPSSGTTCDQTYHYCN